MNMIALKFLSVILAQWMLIQVCYSLNLTGSTSLAATKLQNLTTPPVTSTSSGPFAVTINNTQTIIPRRNESSIQNAFLGKPPPDKNITETYFYDETSDSSTPNMTNANFTFEERISNGSLNISMVAEAVAAPETIPPTFRLQKSAAIAAGVFLVSAVIGYLSCVGYRRYLQRKYGESQMISREDVYDTSDLRYFEI